MQTLADLITEAARRAGDGNALAKTLNVTPQRLSNWKHGGRPCPLHVQAVIAQMAGQDPKAWVWEQVRHQIARAGMAVFAWALIAAACVAPDVAGHGRQAR